LHPIHFQLRLFIHGKEIFPENLEKIKTIKEATEIVKRINVQNGILKKAFEISLQSELSLENESFDLEQRIVYQVLEGYGNFNITIEPTQACVMLYYVVYYYIILLYRSRRVEMKLVDSPKTKLNRNNISHILSFLIDHQWESIFISRRPLYYMSYCMSHTL